MLTAEQTGTAAVDAGITGSNRTFCILDRIDLKESKSLCSHN